MWLVVTASFYHSRYNNIYSHMHVFDFHFVTIPLSCICLGFHRIPKLCKGIGKRFKALYIFVTINYISMKVSVNFLLLLCGYILMGCLQFSYIDSYVHAS